MSQQQPPTGNETGITVEHVSKSFTQADGSDLFVLDDISFETTAEDFVCILGPSGCGKSTLLNLIADLDDPSDGTIRIGSDGAASNVSFVFQDPRLLEWRTVRSNIEYALRGKGIPKDDWEERIEHYLSLVDLAEFVDEYPRSLSGGMQQRVALARALAVESDVVLMDEPFGSLDEITARELRNDLIEIWQQEQATIIFVTHNAVEAAFLAQRMLVLSQRPAEIVADRSIDLAHPRGLDDPDVVRIAEECIEELHEHI